MLLLALMALLDCTSTYHTFGATKCNDTINDNNNSEE